ncbi:MAG: tetratricopeptide repeat protein, partial [Sphingobacteriales bacterium]
MKSAFLYLLLVLMLYACSVRKIPAGQNNKAEEYYSKAWWILQNTTNSALSKELATQALHYSDTAIFLNSKDSKYYRVRGTSYYHLKQYDSAISNFSQAIILDSTNSLAWMNRAIAYENTGRYAIAEPDYLEALKFDPESSTIYFNLGLLYGKWGKDSLSML